MDMDKTPKERIVFDEGVYYGDDDRAARVLLARLFT